MAKRSITLTCKMCGKEFEARARRRTVHCPECAAYLRRNRLGPEQVKRRASAGSAPSVVQVRRICWEETEGDLAYYVERFGRFGVYDGVTPSRLDEITDEDRWLANRIAARMSAKTWSPLVGESIAGIGHSDLLIMSDPEWQDSRDLTHQVFSRLLEHPGIGVARLTKALHRKRAKLIPVCDRVVLQALGVRLGDKADMIIACMDRLRAVGREQSVSLHELGRLSAQLGAEMTELRILELLYWVQFGPFPRVVRGD